jgi:hypothetical protein
MAGSLVDRMVGAAFLNTDTFEEVEHDETATGQAALVVVMVAVAYAIGGYGGGLTGALGAAGAALLSWLVWAGITFLVGTKVFGGTASWGELLRTLGFAQSAGVLAVLGILPLLGWILLMVLPLWIAIAGFIAIRQALDIDNWKTFLVVLVAWGVQMLLHVVF